MIQKLNSLQRIIDSGVIAVVRAESSEKAIKIADAVKAGGIKAIEITMTVPAAVKVIEDLCNAYKDEGDLLIGAGTVLDAETARAVILAGAEFVVSPHLNLDIIRLCHRYQKPIMPGAMTVKEVVEAMENGADIVKFFPGGLFGPEAIKAILGPLPHAPLCPTGGVNLENVNDWIKAGVVCVGVGGELTKGAKTDDYALITRTAKRFVERIDSARKGD